MTMSEDKGRGFPTEQSRDDGYWNALFQMEDVFAREETPALLDIPISFETAEASPSASSDNGQYGAPQSAPTPIETPPVVDPWEFAQQCLTEDQIIELEVIGHNKGGLLVQWNDIQGFVPASQLIDFPQFHIARERYQMLGEWHGRVLRLKIIEVTPSNSRLIFSERATLVAADERADLLNGVRPGDRRTGSVTNLTDFGAFIDLGGVEGLVHISEISWSRVVHPSALLRQGQAVEVLVLSVDQAAARLALSIKRLRPDPWATAETRYKPGQLVPGTVGNITTYGAFIILAEELEGLVHISELAEGIFMHPRDVVHTGERVTARVLTVDPHNKRIALSLRGVGNDPAAGH